MAPGVDRRAACERVVRSVRARAEASTPEALVTRVLGECVYCGAPATTNDHVVPLTRGGSDDAENIVPACRSCNTAKSNRTPEEWISGISMKARRIPHGARRSVYLDDEQWDALASIGQAEDRSVNSVVRLAVVAWIDEHATIDGVPASVRRTLRAMSRAFPKVPAEDAPSFGQPAPAPKPRKRP